jgi:hypothetical protein
MRTRWQQHSPMTVHLHLLRMCRCSFVMHSCNAQPEPLAGHSGVRVVAVACRLAFCQHHSLSGQ